MSALVQALEAATEKDLEAVDAKIKEHGAKLAAYQATRKVLATRLGLTTPTAHKAKKAAAVEKADNRGARTIENRMKIARYLITEGGSSVVMQIVAGTGVPQGSITTLLDHEWFKRQDGKVYVTSAGRQACG